MQRPRLPDYHQEPEPDGSEPWWKQPRESPKSRPHRNASGPRDPNAVYLDTPRDSDRAPSDSTAGNAPQDPQDSGDFWASPAQDARTEHFPVQDAPTQRFAAPQDSPTQRFAAPQSAPEDGWDDLAWSNSASDAARQRSGGRQEPPRDDDAWRNDPFYALPTEDEPWDSPLRDTRGRSDGGSGNGGGRPPRGPKPPREGKPRRRKSRAKRIIGWTAFGLIALVVITGVYAGWAYNTLTSHITHIDVAGLTKPATDIDGAAQNILLVGDDHRPDDVSPQVLAQLHAGTDDGENNTDTMMILHVPADGSPATIISLPRDSWVNIPGNGMGKLNSAYADGEAAGGKGAGAKLLIETVQNLTGLTIDHYVQVSLYGFYTVAQALGPIQVCLKNAVNDPYSGADFPAGTSTLDAAQALAFVRQRHGLPLGDLDREVRQQYFLSVAAHKLLSPATLLNPWQLNAVLSAAGSAVTTDSGLNLLDLAFRLKSLSGIHSATIPISGTPTIYVDGTAVDIVQVDKAAMPGFIRSVIGPPSAYQKATAAAPKDVTVTVLNGGGTNGAAADATGIFKSAGFKVGTPGNTDQRSTTTVQYPAGQESQAKAVAERLPGASVEEAKVSGVTVLLGTDGIMPSPAAPSTGGSGSTASAAADSAGSPPPGSPASKFTSKSCIN